MSFNLYYQHSQCACLRYETQAGDFVERTATSPSGFLKLLPDPSARIDRTQLESLNEVLFFAFRAMPLDPSLPWSFEDATATPAQKAAFDALLTMLRLPSEQRWCTRGEPGSFIQFGYVDNGKYTLGAITLPCGKPWALTFRCEDAIRALPLASPFAMMKATIVCDACDPETLSLPWDTRIKLPLGRAGAAVITLTPESLQ